MKRIPEKDLEHLMHKPGEIISKPNFEDDFLSDIVKEANNKAVFSVYSSSGVMGVALATMYSNAGIFNDFYLTESGLVSNDKKPIIDEINDIRWRSNSYYFSSEETKKLIDGLTKEYEKFEGLDLKNADFIELNDNRVFVIYWVDRRPLRI